MMGTNTRSSLETYFFFFKKKADGFPFLFRLRKLSRSRSVFSFFRNIFQVFTPQGGKKKTPVDREGMKYRMTRLSFFSFSFSLPRLILVMISI